jgi:translation elongation factor EF-1alpha
MDVIVMNKIQSGCCRVGDKYVIIPNRTRVEVTNIYYEEIETDSCVCGENDRLELKNAEEVSVIDRKTGDRIQEHPRFIKQDQVAIARFELTQSGQAICMEPFKRFPQLGRFTLCDEDRTVAVGKILKIVE